MITRGYCKKEKVKLRQIINNLESFKGVNSGSVSFYIMFFKSKSDKTLTLTNISNKKYKKDMLTTMSACAASRRSEEFLKDHTKSLCVVILCKSHSSLSGISLVNG